MEDFLSALKLFEQDPGLAARIRIMSFEWKRAYKHIDVEKEITWAHVWLMANPKQRKKDVVRFLDNWMKSEERRAGEQGNAERKHLKKYVEHRPPDEDLLTAEDFRKLKESLRK